MIPHTHCASSQAGHMRLRTELPFVIKICGITNEEDARVAVDAGANALGFNFYERSPRYVNAQRAREIVEAIEGEYLKVGIFVNPSADEVSTASQAVRLDVAQLHGESCPQLLRANRLESRCGRPAERFLPPTLIFMTRLQTPSGDRAGCLTGRLQRHMLDLGF